MTLKRIPVGLVAGVMAAGLAGAAFAAETPNLVGTWKRTGEGYAAVRFGAAGKYSPEDARPNFSPPKAGGGIVIKEQQGRAFHGAIQSPRGDEVEIVGVVSLDGKRLMMQSKLSWFSGEVLGDKIDLCSHPKREDVARVTCWLLAKE